MTASCSSCRYAEPLVDVDVPVTECRRYPPQMVMRDGLTVEQGWPTMQADGDWCGEYRPRPEA